MSTTLYASDFGAIGDGRRMETQSLQQTIDAAAQHGGRAVIPPGRYLTGTLFLRSGVTLELARGSVLLGSTDLSDYPPQRWGHHDDRTPHHLIFADRCEGASIVGEGTIDGQGSHFWQPEREHERAFWPEIPLRPSPMVEISNCIDVRIEGVTLTGSAGWTLHLHDTRRAWIRGIRIHNTLFGPNTDGIDLTGCRETIISDCHISTGDDAIALKTTEDSGPCEYITVTNCVLETSCAALRLGFESDQDFRHCSFSNCTIRNCSRAIDLLSFRGAVIEHVSFDNIVGRVQSGWVLDRPVEIFIHQVDDAYKVRIPEHPNCGATYPPCPTGAIRHVQMSNLNFETCGRVMMASLPGQECRDISIRGITLRYPMIDDPQPVGPRAEGSHSFFQNLPELRGARAAMVAQHIRDLRVEGFSVDWPSYPVHPESVPLLRSDNRLANPEYYVDRAEEVVSGQAAPPMSAIWGRNLSGGRIDSVGLESNGPEVPAIDLDRSEITVI